MTARNERIETITRKKAVEQLNCAFFVIIQRMTSILKKSKISAVFEHCDHDGDNLFRNVSDVSKHISGYILLRQDVEINYVNNFVTGCFKNRTSKFL
jgi:hypothetical protein